MKIERDHAAPGLATAVEAHAALSLTAAVEVLAALSLATLDATINMGVLSLHYMRQHTKVWREC